MKQKALLLVVCFIVLPGLIFAQSLGDANGDGSITIVDALVTAAYSAGITPSVFFPAAADVCGCDGKIDMMDALTIAQFVSGQIIVFPCAENQDFVLEFSYSGGIAGWVYEYTVDTQAKQLTYAGSGVSKTIYDLTKTQVVELKAAYAAINKVKLPFEPAGNCCCDRYAYRLKGSYTNGFVSIAAQWSDCTIIVPVELTKLVQLLKKIVTG